MLGRGKKLWRDSKSELRRLFSARLDNNRNLICSWLLLQAYLVSNLLSFGFWRVGKSFFVYSILFYSVYLAFLTALLLCYLWIEKHKDISGFKLWVLTAITFPFFWLWSVSLQFDRDWLYVFFLIAFPFVIAVYYRISQSRIAAITVIMLALCTISFLGHADLTLWKQSSASRHPNMEVADITLDRTPNVHVVMFDGLINSEFSKEFLGERSLGADYLLKLDDSIYAGKSGFVESVPTIESWDALFGLGIRRSGEKHNRSLHFSGIYPSPLAILLRENGYMIQTGYADIFFGPKGSYVDNYYLQRTDTSSFRDITICKEKLLGLCNERFHFIFRKINKLGYGKERRNELWEERVIDIIEKSEIHTKAPVFSGFYIYTPGHTKLNYVTGNTADLKEFKSAFSIESERVQNVLERLNELRLEFPESIFIVSGDHGAWLSRTISENENRRFRVLDRHGVALALLNEHNLCPMSRDWLERQRYLTPSRLLAASLACKGDSQKLLEIFSDRKEFITFGESLVSLPDE